MNTNEHSFETADLYWASRLSKQDTLEIFSSSLQALNPDGIRSVLSDGSWRAFGSEDRALLEVSGCVGVARRSAGLMAFMIVACAFDRFQEVMTVGYRDGVPINWKEIRMADIQRRYPDADPDNVRTQAVRAGLLTSINLNELFSRDNSKYRPLIHPHMGSFLRPEHSTNVAR